MACSLSGRSGLSSCKDVGRRSAVALHVPAATRCPPGRSALCLPDAGFLQRSIGQANIACTAAPQSSPSTTHQQPVLGGSSLQQFANAASGEWEGVTATFNPSTGAPLPLPEHLVPSAYRDWGVAVYDWQTTVSSIVTASNTSETGGNSSTPSFSLVCRRMMPTVGCEADAVAFTEDETASQSASGVTIQYADQHGAYIIAPSHLGHSSPSSKGSAAGGAAEAVVEIAIPLTTPSTPEPAAPKSSTLADTVPPGPRQRVRLLHRLRRSDGSADGSSSGSSRGAGPQQWSCKEVEVHFEKWVAPHRAGKGSGEDLAGCGGGMPPFASTLTTAPMTPASSLPGWSHKAVQEARALQAPPAVHKPVPGVPPPPPVSSVIWSVTTSGSLVTVEAGVTLPATTPGKAVVLLGWAEYDSAGQVVRAEMQAGAADAA